jgi:ribonuclease Z
VITSVQAGPYRLRGVSVGGIYTSLHVPELDVGFDVGMPLRSMVGVRTLLLSHGHVDHAGALPAFLGIRALHGHHAPLRVVMPEEIVEDLLHSLEAMSRLQRWPLDIEAVGLAPGQEVALRGDLMVRAFKTFHPVPSLGYHLTRRVKKLKAEFAGMTSDQIRRSKEAGEDMFDVVSRVELAYATDTLVQVLDHTPQLAEARVLVLECTFLDQRKTVEAARSGCHIHLDELLERAHLLSNPHIVLMHLSQLYRPDEVAAILDRRVPPELRARIIPFVPDGAAWPG